MFKGVCSWAGGEFCVDYILCKGEKLSLYLSKDDFFFLCQITMAHAFWWLATWLVLIWAVAGQECSASIPCKIGCCSKWGNCGHGPNCKC